ncbi:MAG: cardiolipin synthase [Deltaproteobacteria bacterium]|nr:cardiolipin synthase [Deltaproteobacteria bacterium]
MSSWTTALTVLEVGWVIVISIGIVLERRSPVATLAWIGILAWLPIFGIVIYYFFGPRRLRRRKMRRQEGSRLLLRAMRDLDQEQGDERWNSLARLAIAAGESPPLPATDVTLYLDGDPLYDALEAAIRAAKHHVHVEYYIFDDDAVGQRMIAALTERAKAGVEVRVVLDGIGAYRLSSRAIAPLRAAGGDVAWFNPVSGFRPRLANFRTHRKIVICDGQLAFTGGMNVTKSHSMLSSGGSAWRDTQVSFRGPACRALQRVFLEDWYFASGKSPPTGEPYFIPVTNDPDAHALVQIVSSGPDRDLYAIHQLFFGAITQAQTRVWITTPYFVPDEVMLAALVAAGLRGVDVRILVPRSSDNALVDYAARSYYPELVRARVQIHEYTEGMLHAKTMVIDDALSIVGTANFDNRSFRLNFEVVAAIYDVPTTNDLARAFEEDLRKSAAVKVREVRDKSVLERLGEGGARLFSPLL